MWSQIIVEFIHEKVSSNTDFDLNVPNPESSPPVSHQSIEFEDKAIKELKIFRNWPISINNSYGFKQLTLQ